MFSKELIDPTHICWHSVDHYLQIIRVVTKIDSMLRVVLKENYRSITPIVYRRTNHCKIPVGN